MSVSAVIAVYNGARYVAAAIDSVLAEPEITELIVVDDGSTDTTPAILRAYGDSITVLTQAQSGQPAALNRGVAVASGELLAFQDADDLWPPGRTAALLAAIVGPAGSDGGNVDGAYGRVEQFVSPDADPETIRRTRIPQTSSPTPLLASTVVRRAAFLRVGPLDETMRTGAMLDWMSRAGAAGLRFATVPITTLRRRVHDDNLGRRVGRDVRDADLLALLRAHLRRQHPDAERAGGS